jgi:hypothetical protein
MNKTREALTFPKIPKTKTRKNMQKNTAVESQTDIITYVSLTSVYLKNAVVRRIK